MRYVLVWLIFSCPMAAEAKCQATTEFRWDTPSATIKALAEVANCIKKERAARIGKWFCYTSRMVGIEPKQSGDFKPDPEKFFVTIDAISTQEKIYLCKATTFGMLNLNGQVYNACLSNFQINFSPDKFVVGNTSSDSYGFFSETGSFVLNDAGEFTLLQGIDKHSYIREGHCEKLN